MENQVSNKKLIPKGKYCYKKIKGKDKKLCVYWRRVALRNIKENGYCVYLNVGDYEINVQNDKMVPVGCRSNKLGIIRKKGELLSRLWNQEKECNFNM